VIYDKWVSKKVAGSSRLLWAWSQTSRYTMSRFKNTGHSIVLESPMIHVNSWCTILEKEYIKHTGQKFSDYFFSERLKKRMLDEYSLADRVITLSSFTNETFEKNGFEPSKLCMVKLYAEDEIFTPLAKSQHQGLSLLFVGRCDILKGIPLLLQTFYRLESNVPGITLTLVGDIKPEVKQMLKEKHAIKCEGTVSKQKLASYYREADMLILSSVQESFGQVILECIASGTHVIASKNSGAPDIAKESNLVDVFNPENELELEEMILNFYHNPITGTATLPATFSKKNYNSQVVSIINEFLNVHTHETART
jgi:glycosyltransferase involved in cell wall biosynthesis